MTVNATVRARGDHLVWDGRVPVEVSDLTCLGEVSLKIIYSCVRVSNIPYPDNTVTISSG